MLNHALKSQYHAALKTLKHAIDLCPDAYWDRPEDGRATFWRVAYHTLFFGHFYLCKDHQSFTPWSGHEDEMPALGKLLLDGSRPPKPSSTLSRPQLMEYWSFLSDMINPGVDALDLSSPDSGFPWYPISKLEHQLVNIRHIQHHSAALSMRLKIHADIAVPWVGAGIRK